jgi:hypothetical protein
MRVVFQVRVMIASNFFLKTLKKSFEIDIEKMRIRYEIILLYIFVLRTSNHAGRDSKVSGLMN